MISERKSARIDRIMHRLGFGKDECSRYVAMLRTYLTEIAAKGELSRFSAGNVSETLNNEEYARRLLVAHGVDLGPNEGVG